MVTLVSKKRRRICAALIIANIVFIWGNSLLPGEYSGALSDFVRRLLLFWLPDDGLPSVGGHGLLRKAAHLTEFACLGALLCQWLRMKSKNPWLGMLPGVCVASLDEIIQRFVPGRGPRVTDVAIDTLGVTLGIAAISIIVKLNSTKRRKKQ